MKRIAVENSIRDQKFDKMQDALFKFMEEMRAASSLQRINTAPSNDGGVA